MVKYRLFISPICVNYLTNYIVNGFTLAYNHIMNTEYLQAYYERRGEFESLELLEDAIFVKKRIKPIDSQPDSSPSPQPDPS